MDASVRDTAAGPAAVDDDGVKELPAGTPVVVRTVLGDQHEGTIYAWDNQTGCMMLQQDADAGSLGDLSSYQMFRISFLKEVRQLAPPASSPRSPHSQRPRLTLQDAARLRAKAEKLQRQYAAECSRVGVGVSPWGQKVFNGLSKTMPCRWEKDVIVVMEEVRVAPPYSSEQCSGTSSGSVERVRKVLDKEGERLSEPTSRGEGASVEPIFFAHSSEGAPDQVLS